MTYEPFIFDAEERNYGMDTTGIQAFSPPHPMVCIHSWSMEGSYYAGLKGNYGKMAAVLTQNGVAKGFSMQIQKKWDDTSAAGFMILAASKGGKFQISSQWEGQGAMYSTIANGKTSFSGYQIA